MAEIQNIDFGSEEETGSGSAGTSTLTNSISPVANKLYLLSVATDWGGSAEPNTPSVSGCNLTWELVESAYYDTTSSSRRKLTLFRAMGSSPTSGQVTISMGAQNQNAFTWSIEEVTDAKTSGSNGADAIVQTDSQVVTDNSNDEVNMVLNAFADPLNLVFAVFSEADSGHTMTFDKGVEDFINLSSQTGLSAPTLYTAWKQGEDTAIELESSGAIIGGGIAIEIALADETPTRRVFMIS